MSKGRVGSGARSTTTDGSGTHPAQTMTTTAVEPRPLDRHRSAGDRPVAGRSTRRVARYRGRRRRQDTGGQQESASPGHAVPLGATFSLTQDDTRPSRRTMRTVAHRQERGGARGPSRQDQKRAALAEVIPLSCVHEAPMSSMVKAQVDTNQGDLKVSAWRAVPSCPGREALSISNGCNGIGRSACRPATVHRAA